MECAKCNEEAGNELYCDECQKKVELETAIEMQGAEIVQLRARVAELEATQACFLHDREECLPLKEKIAAGLRRCKTPPDYLVFICRNETVFDESSILGIPVIFANCNVVHSPWGDSDLPFIPCWVKEKNCVESINFERGYNES
jgi:hypothetical protein